ncbi:MAG: phosphatase PAP2 family protein [Flavisolibacter sp.]
MKKARLLCSFLFTTMMVHSQVNVVSESSDTLNLRSNHFTPKPDARKSEVYRIRPAVDIPVTLAGVASSLYGFSKIYNRDTSTIEEIEELDKNDIAPINRSGASQYSPKAFDASNMFFYGSMPLPLLLMLDKHMRKDAGKIGLMYLQALGITGTLYSTAAMIHPKYRPYAYNPEAPMERRVRGGAKNSFYAGHVALVGTATFFTAKVFADYHPESNLRFLFYTVAGAATATTAYLRYKAGEHFPTDVLIGATMGTLTGILVPQLHKNKNPKETGVSLIPYYGREKGLAMLYRF